MNWDVAEVSQLPLCDFCGKTHAAYDAQTKKGPWAYMCEECFQIHSRKKLGLGYGQRLVLVDKS